MSILTNMQQGYVPTNVIQNIVAEALKNITVSGNIPISQITGLQAAINAKATDSSVVHLTGNESVSGTKTFSNVIASQAVFGGTVASTDARVEIRQSGGTDVFACVNSGQNAFLVDGSSRALVNQSTVGSASAQLEITPSSSSTVGQAIYLKSSQTADALRVISNTNSTLAKFDAHGALGFNFGSSGLSFPSFVNLATNDAYNGNFAFSLASFANNGTDPHPDVVLALGYNTDGTSLFDSSKPGCSTNLESYYVPNGLLGGTPQFEYHAAQVHYTDGTIKRPWTVAIPYDKSSIAQAFTSSTISWEAIDGTQQILTTWPTIELKNNTAFLQNVNNLAWLNQRATDGSSNISLAMVDNSNRTVFGQTGRAAYLPGSSVTIDNPLYAGSNVGVGTTNPNVAGQASNVRVVTSSGTDVGGFGGFETNTLSTSVDALAGYYGFTASGQSTGYRLPSFIGAWLEGSTSGKLGASLRFHTQPNNTAGAVERFRVTSNGNFLINQTALGSGSAQFETTSSSSSTPILAGYTSGGLLGILFRPDGSVQLPHLADTAAVNDSLYYSTTQSKICYKDSSGTANPLY